MGHIGCTSFFPSKNLGCFGDGGALFTNDSLLENKIRVVANHGMTKRYYHDEIGVNSRLDTIQAAVLKIKLKYLDQYNTARLKAAEFYDKELADIPQIKLPVRSKNSTHIFHQYTIVIKDEMRDGLKAHLEKNNIPAMIYYPVPIHMQKAFKCEINKDGNFPVTEFLGQHVLSLPMHTELDEEQMYFICSHIKSFFK
jgi:dTDP-4-amino-4,6-dideoxygalactose transaminase